MPEVIQYFFEAIKEQHWFASIVMGLFLLVFLIERTKRFSMDVRDRNASFYRESLNTEYLDDDVRVLLKEKVNADLFYHMTEIAGDALVRKQVREIVENSNGAFSVAAFKRIWDFAEVKEHGLFIELKGWSYFKYQFDRVWIWVLLAAAFSAVIELWFLWANRTLEKNFLSIGVALGCFLFAAVTARSKRSYELARNINGVLRKLNEVRIDKNSL